MKNPDLQRLKTIKPTLHRSLAALTATQNRTFKNTLTERWAAHGAVNQQLEHILDVRGLSIADPLAFESEVNQWPGVVTVGVFAHQKASVCLLGTAQGVRTLAY